ncbi:MAG: BON domain-containing protein [Thermoguttaceae bacterium]
MRCFLSVLLVAGTATLVSAVARAGNQEVAEQIVVNLRANGLSGQTKIGVKFSEGTAWVKGQAQTQEQMDRILTVVKQTGGVQNIVNEMTIGGGQQGSSAGSGSVRDQINAFLSNPLRRTEAEPPSRAQQVGTSVPASREAVPTALMQPVPAPPAPLPGGEAIPPGTVGAPGGPMPMYSPNVGGGPAPMRTDQPSLPAYAWPTYSAYPNYAAVTYPKQYSPTAWPYIGPFYPYPQVPLGWRKVSLQWDDGWWFLEFHDKPCCVWWR